jgi:hypothetical protein
MKNTLSLAIAAIFMVISHPTLAAPDNVSPDAVPPAQKQKNQVPETNQNGNYLETQQDNNNPPKNPKGTGDQQQNGRQQTNAQPSKPANMEKSKRFHQDPQQGGTGVKQP